MRRREEEEEEEKEETCVAMQCYTLSLPDLKKQRYGGIFDDWRKARFPKVATLEPGGLFNIMISTQLSSWKLVSLVQIDASSLNYWLAKFIQEVAKPPKERYQAKMFFFDTRLCVEKYVVSSRKSF